MKGSNSYGEENSPFLVIFSDLDGTLLDESTYSWVDAREAIEVCKRRSIPIVLVSSKTRAEMEVISTQLRLGAPFVTENGGGVFFPKKTFPHPPPGADPVNGLWKWALGVRHETLRKALRDIATETGCKLIGLSDMETLEITSLTGLDADEARRAAKREFDEPFLIMDIDKEKESCIVEAARRRGLRVIKGGRFFHLCGKSDKGTGTRKIIAWYRDNGHNVFSLGIGDSENDFPMLQTVDQPIFVGDPGKLHDLKARLPALIITKEKGPKGWNEGVMNFLRTHGGTH